MIRPHPEEHHLISGLTEIGHLMMPKSGKPDLGASQLNCMDA